jgi:hypothetical protein
VVKDVLENLALNRPRTEAGEILRRHDLLVAAHFSRNGFRCYRRLRFEGLIV